jgi:hypothetical protein
MGTRSACARWMSSTSKAHRWRRWLGSSRRAAGRVSSCGAEEGGGRRGAEGGRGA